MEEPRLNMMHEDSAYVLNIKTFRSLCSSSRHGTPSGERVGLVSSHYSTPRTPLPGPTQLRRDRPQVTLGDRWLAAGHLREKQNRLLDVRG
jgi:hypothetical protein